MGIDKDLISRQQARDLAKKASAAQKIWAQASQEEVDRVVEAAVKAGADAAQQLAEMAVEETCMGIVQDKVVKNLLATKILGDYIRDMRTVGVVNEDQEKKIVEIAEPVGTIAGITPTTNPTSTVLYKAIIALKSRNAIVFSPHPRAVRCSCEAARTVYEAAVKAGAPEGIIGCMDTPTMEGTRELMTYPDVSFILATGGTSLVHAAYSSGKPAIGVGPGNVPVYIERTADVEKAVRYIILSKTFDNGTVCASEQHVVTERVIEDVVVEALKENGAYFLDSSEKKKVEEVVVRNGGINPKVVGQPATKIAEMAGIKVPLGTKVLIANLSQVGPHEPLSGEKLCPVLGFYTVDNWVEACELCISLLQYMGIGHTLAIHSQNEAVVMEFALKKPISRIVWNSPSTHGAVGLTTGLAPALTLSCGAMGGSSTADNVTPYHLLNIKRLCAGIKDPEELNFGSATGTLQRQDLEAIVREVLRRSPDKCLQEVESIVWETWKRLQESSVK
ncbi:MAG: Aldehyde-alcohol dehydrogenase AdhE [Thermacetogenium phaeum]|uniref:Aldehyde-alcohol dehydrogenase AdhE n=1 Tax=Thermacetogenium phaeum TaxID=85874 RepID=A0A101FHI2_9THEO|nr:MAG: Aldehyde-alcohol dehydrogenase AdhE [Thermacetogenium phaeum]